jgi:uncharacterized protein YutE (UPF0331/DUF86 family)
MIDRVISKIEKVRQSISLIRSNTPSSFDDFMKLGLIKDGIHKRLEYSVELFLDIVNIINSELKLGIPNGTQDVIQRLVKNNIINNDIAELLKEMKSFRNILVHNYGDIDDRIVYQIITERLDDFEKISQAFMDFLKRMQNKSYQEDNKPKSNN